MCEKGVNTDQLKLMLEQAGDAVSMAQQWLERIHHIADTGGMHHASTSVAQATVLLGEAHAKLDDVIEGLDEGDDNGVTIERV